MKIQTISCKLKNNIINLNKPKDLIDLSKTERMMVHSIPLKDGTTAEILANHKELDILLMRDGRCLASRGFVEDNVDKIAYGIARIFDQIEKHSLAAPNVDLRKSFLHAIGVHDWFTKSEDGAPPNAPIF